MTPKGAKTIRLKSGGGKEPVIGGLIPVVDRNQDVNSETKWGKNHRRYKNECWVLVQEGPSGITKEMSCTAWGGCLGNLKVD